MKPQDRREGTKKSPGREGKIRRSIKTGGNTQLTVGSVEPVPEKEDKAIALLKRAEQSHMVHNRHRMSFSHGRPKLPNAKSPKLDARTEHKLDTRTEHEKWKAKQEKGNRPKTPEGLGESTTEPGTESSPADMSGIGPGWGSKVKDSSDLEVVPSREFFKSCSLREQSFSCSLSQRECCSERRKCGTTGRKRLALV